VSQATSAKPAAPAVEPPAPTVKPAVPVRAPDTRTATAPALRQSDPQSAALIDSLEAEMARLLGRPVPKKD
jgi:hypothetical protein